MKTAPARTTTIQLDIQTIKTAKNILTIIDHPLRLKMLQLMEKAGEIRVAEIYHKMRLNQATASFHLAQLRKWGIANSRSEGKCRYYSVNHSRLKQIESLAAAMVEPPSTS